MAKRENIFKHFPLDVTNFENCPINCHTLIKFENNYRDIDICFLCSKTYSNLKDHKKAF